MITHSRNFGRLGIFTCTCRRLPHIQRQKASIDVNIVKLNVTEGSCAWPYGVFPCTGKNVKSTKTSTVLDQMLWCDNIVSLDKFFVLANGTNCFRINLQESTLIHRD